MHFHSKQLLRLWHQPGNISHWACTSAASWCNHTFPVCNMENKAQSVDTPKGGCDGGAFILSPFLPRTTNSAAVRLSRRWNASPRLHVSLTVSVTCARMLCMIYTLSLSADNIEESVTARGKGRACVCARAWDTGRGSETGRKQTQIAALTYILESCKQFSSTDVPPIPALPKPSAVKSRHNSRRGSTTL